jgi:phage terminase large subunit
MAGGHTVRFVLIGNPNRASGPFHDAFRNPLYNKIHISAFDVPNVKERRQVVPGLATHEWVEEMAAKYGVDSDIYRVRVLGEFPRNATDTLIGIDDIERAFGCDRELHSQDDHIIGLDVARYGDDSSAFVDRQGNKAKVLEKIYGNSTMELAGKAARYLRQFKTARMHIDIVGVGAGVFDRLREQPDIEGRVFGVNNAAAPRSPEDFINVRIEAWTNVRDWLRDANLEKHEDFYQLAQPKYKINSNGKMQLESKDDMKKRGVKSPDVGDALALTLSRPTEGGAGTIEWI